MNGTPAGWYDDPENPGQQRYWDGSAWTEHRAPGGEAPAAADAAAPTPPPAAAPTATPPPPPPGAPVGAPGGAPGAAPWAPPPATPAKSSRKALWIVLSIVGVLFVLIIVAIAAVAFLGDDATDVVEENLPQALEENFAAQGLEVNIPSVDCDGISNDDGPFTTSCSITIEGLAQPLTAEVSGTISGSTVTVTDAESDATILNEELAVKAAQPVVDAIDPTVTVQGCTLPETLMVVEDGLTFTCETDTNETVTFEIQGGQLEITEVR